MIRTGGFAVALGCLLAFTAGAQRFRAVAVPTYQPGIDVLDYDVSLVLPDSGPSLKGDVTIALRRAHDVNVLKLDLVDSMHVERVDVNGRQVTESRPHGRIEVPLAGRRDSVSVRVRYSGNVTDGLIVQRDDRGRWTWFGDNWPDRARHWLPLVDHPSDKASVSWKIDAPATHTVVANGTLLSRKNTSAGRAVTRWREARPVTSYVMTIGAAPFAKYDVPARCHVGDMKQCVRQTVYVLPENASWLPGVFSHVDSIVGLFERLVGPFPYEKLAHVQSNTRFGGMENSSAIFYDGKLFEKQRVSASLLAHETAHQWFGDAVTEREWSHLWLSEGFATYFAALYTRQSQGDSAYRAEMSKIRKKLLTDRVVAERPVIDTAQTDYMKLLNANSYEKGGYVLYMLHEEIGDSAFFGALRSYYAKYRHSTVLTDNLRVEFERTSGRSLQQFFDQWLRRPGVAELSINSSYDSQSGRETLTVEQTGAGGPYALRVPMLVTDYSGSTTSSFLPVPAQRTFTYSFAAPFSKPPRLITFDSEGRLLARISNH